MRHFLDSRWPSVAMMFFLMCTIGIYATGCQREDTINKRSLVTRTPEICSPGEAVDTDGHRRLALIVGVGEYKNANIPDLKGPPNDARRFYELLTGKNGYAFPKQNVCLLLNEQATTGEFKQLFDTALVERARENDVVVIFFAGHGSQARDKNGDEPDEWDETLMFHDARTEGIGDLRDDEFNQMLARLYRKTRYITVILDSCNAGTATRDPAAARFFEPMADDADADPSTAAAGGDQGAGWVTESLAGTVIFSAATDSNPALEKNGRGIFTDALLQILGNAGNQTMTYAQAARQIPLLVASESPQVPYFHGDLSRTVFDSKSRDRPIAWEVIKVGPPLELGGPALPGIGEGAEFRIYDGAVIGADTRDPGKSKATVILTHVTGLNAIAGISAAEPDHPEIKPGDLAVMVRPANSYIALKVRIRPPEESGGIPADRALKIRNEVEKDKETGLSITLVEGPGDFELSVGNGDRLILKGPENRIRNSYASDTLIAESLRQHARQRALLQLRGDGGSDFTDNETLKVSLIPVSASKQNRCADGIWEQAEPNTLQIIPLCHAWNIQVALSSDSPKPLLIGALILSTDGGMFALPRDRRKIRLMPGEHYLFNASGETFLGTPPLNVQDRIIVFGTQETNPVEWGQFAQPAASRSPGTSGLQQALYRYFQNRRRGIQTADQGIVENSTWTLSSISLRVEANQRFLNTARAPGQPFDWREYTLTRFDIRPYLPDDETTALYKVLERADRLARASAGDGYGYRQHAWDGSSDEDNLQRGIDCSRSIWFAFTRSGLPYNRDDRYLTTAMMVSDDTRMQDEFDLCDDQTPLQIGDILVYRDDIHGDGHVVMVIDPEKRIAWGSHGWDGNPRILPVEPDTGIEYQKIKYKQDWERWDRKTMTRKACWRYRRFAEEIVAYRGQPGLKALKNICNDKLNCGR